VQDIIQDTLKILDGKFKFKNIKLILDIEKVQNKIFKIDVMRLQQVLINLIMNAIKYSTEYAAIEI